MQMSNVEQLEGEIRSLAKNLRLGSSIASYIRKWLLKSPPYLSEIYCRSSGMRGCAIGLLDTKQ